MKRHLRLKKSTALSFSLLTALASPGLAPYAALAQNYTARSAQSRTPAAPTAMQAAANPNLRFSINALPIGLTANPLAASLYDEANALAAAGARTALAAALPLSAAQTVQTQAVERVPSTVISEDALPLTPNAEVSGDSLRELKLRHAPGDAQEQDSSSRGLAAGLRSFAGKLQNQDQGRVLNGIYHNFQAGQDALAGASTKGLWAAPSGAKGLARWSASAGNLAMTLMGKSAGGGSAAREEKNNDPFRKKKEVAWTSFYLGGHNLKFYSGIRTWLDPEKEKPRMDALSTLIAIADRNIQDGPIPEERLEKVRNPSPAMAELLQERGLTQGQVLGWQPITDQLKIDRDNYMPAEIMQRGSLLGVTAPKFLVEEGGLGLSQLAYGRMFRSLAYQNFAKAAKVSAIASIGKVPVEVFGTEDQKTRFLPPVARGKAAGAFGLTEVGAGTDLDELATKAEITGLNLNVDMTVFDKVDPQAWAKLSGEEKKAISAKKKAIQGQLRQALLDGKGKIVLNNAGAEKVFITNVWDSDYVIVIAGQTLYKGVDLGPTAVIVPLGYVFDESPQAKLLKTAAHAKDGLEITHFIGTPEAAQGGQELNTIRSTGQSYIVFKNYAVEGRNILGPIGKGKIIPMISLNSGRVGVMALSAASMRAPYEFMKAWAVDRSPMFKELYGGRLGSMQRTQRMLGEAAMKLALSEDMADFADALVDYNHEKGDSRSVASLSAAAKVRGTQWGKEIVADVADLMGGHFHFTRAPHRMELALRQASIGEKIEGVNPAMAQFPHKLALSEITASKGSMLKSGGAIVWNLSTKFLLAPSLLAWALVVITLTGVFGAAFSLWSLAPFALLPLLLTINRGDFSFQDAYYIQNRTARAAALFDTRGAIKRERAVEDQEANIAATELNTDIFMLMDTLKRLNDAKLGRGEPLTDEERIAREGAVEWLKARIDRDTTILPRFWRWLRGRTPDKIATRVGRRIFELALTQNLEPVVSQHKGWMRQFHDEYQQALQEYAARAEGQQNP